MKLTYVIQMYKTTSPIKNGINRINILYTSSYKSIPIYQVNKRKKLKVYFNMFVLNKLVLNKMKLTRVIQMCKNIFAIKMVITVLTFHAQDLTKL